MADVAKVINHIDDNISSILLKFADDTKMLSAATTVDDVNKLRTDLSLLCKWSED